MGDSFPMLAGIDLGATRCSIATLHPDGRAESLDLPGEGKVMPATVMRGEKSMSAGSAALSEGFRPGRTYSGMKRHFGDTAWRCAVDGRSFHPETLTAFLLKKGARLAEESTGRRILSSTITVPTIFNEIERKAAQDAGLIAGLSVAGIINESAAAAMAFGIERRGGPKKTLVIHLGAGSCDATILKVDEAKVETVAV